MPRGEFPGAEGVSPMCLGDAPDHVESGLRAADADGRYMTICEPCGGVVMAVHVPTLAEACRSAAIHLTVKGHAVLVVKVVAEVKPV